LNPDATLHLPSGEAIPIIDGRTALRVANCDTTGLVDSGAAVNAIHPNQVPPGTPRQPDPATLGTASTSGQLCSTGTVDLQTNVANTKLSINYHEVPNLKHNVILGQARPPPDGGHAPVPQPDTRTIRLECHEGTP
jgi:hypothetical protein